MAKNNTDKNSVDIVNNLTDSLKALLDATDHLTQEDLKKIKNNSQRVLNQATDYLKHNGIQLAGKAKQAAVSAESYIKANPWKTAAISAMLAYALNTLFTRKR